MDIVAITPPLSAADSDSLDDRSLEDDYFSKTYVPLSNLPTPPPPKHSIETYKDPKSALQRSKTADVTLIGPAIHLCNLVPTSASLLEPDVCLVHDMLARANLTRDTIALAVCILDCLNSRFALLWRRTLPTKPSDFSATEAVHIDNVHPEVIILGALMIAVKFLDDSQISTGLCAEYWGSNRWSCDQINVTEHCVNENLDYRIHPLWKADLIGDALKDMETAGIYAHRNPMIDENLTPVQNLSAATKKLEPTWAQRPLTPADSSRSSLEQPENVAMKTKDMEPFPAYVDSYFG